jgi:hypothetical protein
MHFRLVVYISDNYWIPLPLHIDELQLFESTLGVGTSATTAKLTVDGGLGLAKGSQVFAGSDVITEFPKHDRPLVTKYPEVAMTAATHRVGTRRLRVVGTIRTQYPNRLLMDLILISITHGKVVH